LDDFNKKEKKIFFQLTKNHLHLVVTPVEVPPPAQPQRPAQDPTAPRREPEAIVRNQDPNQRHPTTRQEAEARIRSRGQIRPGRSLTLIHLQQ